MNARLISLGLCALVLLLTWGTGRVVYEVTQGEAQVAIAASAATCVGLVFYIRRRLDRL